MVSISSKIENQRNVIHSDHIHKMIAGDLFFFIKPANSFDVHYSCVIWHNIMYDYKQRDIHKIIAMKLIKCVCECKW